MSFIASCYCVRFFCLDEGSVFKPVLLFTLMSSGVYAQTIERRVVDIVYGDKVIRTTHQVVLDSELDVGVIRAEETKPEVATNMVITASDSRLSYLEQSTAAIREQAIYDEVNRRTRDAPYTVLFTGHIPDDIQNKRMAMMPEVGLFGSQKDKLLNNQGDIMQEIGLPADASDKPNAGKFSSMKSDEQSARNSGASELNSDLNNFINGGSNAPKSNSGLENLIEGEAPSIESSNDEMLEKLIGG
ncbi:hypothetical protein A9Q77_03760 [Marinomonas sp. 42_23_T18]|nr:hypothetical protein A9Q77_03760 [Marinomonas sp. 42_23_T18]